MTQERGITPMVGRLMVVNATVLLLLQTVFTAPAFVDALQFAPGQAARHPWTLLSYMFVHAGLLHLAGNMLLLFIFGPPVERRMGAAAFLLFYLYCGVGAAAFALGLSSVLPIHPFVGASGAVLGVALATAVFSARGAVGSATLFTAGLRPALLVAAGLSLLGTGTALALRRHTAAPAPIPDLAVLSA